MPITARQLADGNADLLDGLETASANTASTVVVRDSSGNFSANTITATLSGNATNVTGTVAIANGGTGATTAAAARTNLAVLGNSGQQTITKAVHASGTDADTLQLAAPDSGSSAGEISIRFHHINQWFYQLRARVDGFHFTNGNTNVYTSVAGGVFTGTSFNGLTGLSNTLPIVAGTATIGVSTLAARQDHVHPVQTTITGNAGTVTNGVYTTGSYADPAWITSINYTKLTGTVPTWNQSTTGNAATATTWQTARTVTIGNTGKSVNGSANVSWSSSEIGYDGSINNVNSGVLRAAANYPEGAKLNPDEEFGLSTNGLLLYNNSGGSNVTITRLTGQVGVPNSTGAIVRVEYNGGGIVSPGAGGFTFNTTSRAGARYVNRFTAKIPVGRSIIYAANAYGDNSISGWLTPNVGTGKWEEYAYEVICGVTGSFSIINFFYLDGTAAYVWDIASATVIEVTNKQDLSSLKLNVLGNVSSTSTTTGSVVVTGGLGVSENVYANRLHSTVANGTAPLSVVSSTLVTNLNADFLDGLHSATANTINTVVARDGSGNFSAGTITANLTGTASNATRLTNLTSTTTTTAGTDNTESCVSYISGISLLGQVDGALYSHVYSASWKHNIYGDYRTGQLAIRGKNNGVWQAWRTVLDSTNYTTYAPTLTGTGASGSWGISVTGTSANVTGTVAVANGGTGATTAAAARTGLGATTVGSNLFTLTNPSAITFVRINADNTVSTLDASTFRTAIGAGTSSTTGTVTSVGGTGTVSGITLSGSVTATGNLTLGGTLAVTPSNFASQTANTVLIAPNGVAGVPTFRTLVAADIPTLNQNTTGTSANVTGTVAIANGGTGGTTASAGRINLLPAIAGQAGKVLAVNGTATDFEYIAVSGGSGGTVTSVSGTGTVSGITLSGTVTATGNLTLSGTLAVTPSNFASQTANTFLSAPNGAAGVPTFRAIVAADIPTLNQSTTGNAATATSSPLLSTLGNYAWSSATLPTSYSAGIQSSFVGPAVGEGSWQSYGSVMTMRTYSGGGGSLQMYVPYSPTNGGIGLQVRFGNYDVSLGNSWTAWKVLLASDNYNTYAPTLTGTGASGTWGISITGNAVNLSTTRANWSTNGTISAVVGQIAWRNYANGHTIFDASAGLSPDGTSVNNTNPTNAWSATYPTLMGWNGINTYGVRVDSSRTADSAAAVTGTVAIANGGTGATTAGAALTALGAQATLISGTNIKTINSTSLLGSGNITVSGGVTYTRVTTATTLTNNQGVIADTTGGVFTINLPAAPTSGNQVWIADGGSWSTNNLTVDPNGSTIEGFAVDENLVCNVGGIELHLLFDGTRWNVHAIAGGSGGTAVSETGTQTLTNKTLTSPVITQNVQVISTNTTAIASRTYVLTSTLTLTLPASPIAGTWVTIINRSATVTPIVARNAQNIMGLAEDLTIDSLDAPITLTFADSTRGWVLS